MPDDGKTTAWTPEERAEMGRQRAFADRDAWARDARGHAVLVPSASRAGLRPWEGHICPCYEHCSLCVDEAWDCAAAVMGGLMAMGWAIRERYGT